MTGRSFPLCLALTYNHTTGDLTDYFDELTAGHARASRCPSCGDVRIPPRFTCPDDGTTTETVDLEGTGRIIALTHGDATLPLTGDKAAHSFVLVAMDGADNFMFGRMLEGNRTFRYWKPSTKEIHREPIVPSG